ncbi:BTB/POZ domain-containing protein At5g03250-like [Cannabis sativa]|uniref:BTB/POZ domain-containing protein At5g03250-like n=1 Tax=Cannabis sativa TaxID=3483 RepID=UPI0029CA7941|nr:BTB/POZ domain-containing protein At5g03250-like [Cannabis sativa]
MACMRLGSKSEAFHREGRTWLCTTGLPSDIAIEVGEMSFHLHKFPLLSRSGLLEKLIEELNNGREEATTELSSTSCVLELHDLPGGAKAFELVAKFCYGVKTEITSSNVVSLRCAAEYLQMTEDMGERNLISLTESLLSEVFSSWVDSIKALETCEEVQTTAEELHIVSRLIDSLATKACADPGLFNWPLTDHNDVKNISPKTSSLWNGIYSETKPLPLGDDWWFDDVSFLSLNLYKRFILAVEAKGMKPETIALSIMYYAKKYLPIMNTQTSLNDYSYVNNSSSGATISESEMRTLLEEIVGLIPYKKGVTSSKSLLKLLRVAMILQASSSCRENLEKRIGTQLDQASLVDLLIPNMGYSVETLYDIECVQRILDNFLSVSLESSSPCIVEEGHQVVSTAENNNCDGLGPMTMVATLVDGYLAEVAVDVNLKLPKFQALAAIIPDYVRPVDDGIYNAIDVYLKAHPWITDSDREQLCRLMNCQKLSLEASTHAAQNDRLPLRVIVQVLFFEQLRLRTSISGWFFVSDNLDTSQNLPISTGNLGLIPRSTDHGCRSLETVSKDQEQIIKCSSNVLDDHAMKLRVSEIEKECSNMKKELQKLTKTKKSWSLLPKSFGFRKKSQSNSTQKELKRSSIKLVVPPESALDANKKNIADQKINNGELAHISH